MNVLELTEKKDSDKKVKLINFIEKFQICLMKSIRKTKLLKYQYSRFFQLIFLSFRRFVISNDYREYRFSP